MSNSPIVDETILYQVYFEVADQASCLQSLQQSAIASVLATGVRTEKFGFYLSVTNPTIPTIIKTLVLADHTLYQVKRQPIAADIGYMI